MQKKRKIKYHRGKKSGWKKIKYELGSISPHLAKAFQDGWRTPEGWGRFENGELVEAIYVDYEPSTKHWCVNHWPSGDILDTADTKKVALGLAKIEVEFRLE